MSVVSLAPPSLNEVSREGGRGVRLSAGGSPSMHIGTLTVQIEIAGADSLKDKRQVVKSLLERIRGKFNVSAAEVGDLDIWRKATLGFAVVANEAKFIDQVLEKLVDTIESEPRLVVLDYQRENF